jgi:hypothetical protein
LGPVLVMPKGLGMLRVMRWRCLGDALGDILVCPLDVWSCAGDVLAMCGFARARCLTDASKRVLVLLCFVFCIFTCLTFWVHSISSRGPPYVILYDCRFIEFGPRPNLFMSNHMGAPPPKKKTRKTQTIKQKQGRNHSNN